MFAFLPFFPFFLLRQRIEFIYYLVLCLIVPKFVRFFSTFFFFPTSVFMLFLKVFVVFITVKDSLELRWSQLFYQNHLFVLITT